MTWMHWKNTTSIDVHRDGEEKDQSIIKKWLSDSKTMYRVLGTWSVRQKKITRIQIILVDCLSDCIAFALFFSCLFVRFRGSSVDTNILFTMDCDHNVLCIVRMMPTKASIVEFTSQIILNGVSHRIVSRQQYTPIDEN